MASKVLPRCPHALARHGPAVDRGPPRAVARITIVPRAPGGPQSAQSGRLKRWCEPHWGPMGTKQEHNEDKGEHPCGARTRAICEDPRARPRASRSEPVIGLRDGAIILQFRSLGSQKEGFQVPGLRFQELPPGPRRRRGDVMARDDLGRARHSSARSPATPTSATATHVCGMPSTGTNSTAPTSAPTQPPTRSAP